MNEFSPDIKKDVFPFNKSSTYLTENTRLFTPFIIKTACFGSETLSHLGPKI